MSKFEDFKYPDFIPLFPLDGVLLLPRGELPLHVFEPRYIALVDDALKNDRLVGIIQPRSAALNKVCGDHLGDGACTPRTSSGESSSKSSSSVSNDEQPTIESAASTVPLVAGDVSLYDVGCVGRITSFSEADDGRYYITLTGMRRFKLLNDVTEIKGYRRGSVSWEDFKDDHESKQNLNLDRVILKNLLGAYFEQHEISCDWSYIDCASDEKLVTSLSMICPFDALEKQVLLETYCGVARAEKFLLMLEMAVKAGGNCGGHGH
jgi:Lon protease-like protein